MANLYVDTSALVKVYVAEAGSRWMQNMCRPSAGNTVFTSRLALVELEVAVIRKAAERAITEADRDRSLALFRRHVRRRYALVSLTDEIGARALQFIHTPGPPHPLRTYDAMHLASAQLVVDALTIAGGASLTFVAADRRLLDVARHLGFATDNPEDHP